ncbi:MAG TPA: ribonuclease J [Chloroflexota bacterium]|nr:ribonuclease J [Chloroflexota bacterium]
MSTQPIRVIPLGGVGEIGKNATLVEYGDDLILVDAGLKFPEEEMLGIDLVIPDLSFLREIQHRLRAIIITHGHEDHIGALPYILSSIDVPVYATRLTCGLITVKLKEHRLLGKRRLETLVPNEILEIGPFQIQPFRVTHSIPDAVGFAIHTPGGTIVFTGDFKFDQTPLYGPPPDFATLAAIGQRGVLALLSDCTRVEKAGYTQSERVIERAFDDIIRDLPGRVIITTFASNITRVQQALNVASRHGRKVALVGRSMENNCAIANELHYLDFPEDTVFRLDDVRRFPLNEVMLVTTGSQGEPSSVLSRIASGDHRQIKAIPGDTVILSATPIPGNEETVARTIDNLMRLGGDVIYEPMADVHVSGHGSREELKLMLNLLRPRYCVPVHGEYRHLVLYRRMAAEVGIPTENVLLAEIGDVIQFDDEGVRTVDHHAVGSVLVDGVTVGGTTEVVLRDRQHLSRDGVLIVSLTLDRTTGSIIAGPEVISRGFIDPTRNGDSKLLDEARERIREAIEEPAATTVEYGFVVSKIKETISDYIYKQTHARPMVLPVVTEI